MAVGTKPLSAQHDILIVERTDNASPKLLETLKRKNFNVRTIAPHEDAHSALLGMTDPILIVDCGAQKGCRDFMASFLFRPELFSFPLLVLGKDIDGLEQELSEFFGLAVVLRAPSSTANVLEMIAYISRVYVRVDARTRAQEKEKKPVSKKEISETSGEDEGPKVSHPLYGEHDTIPNVLLEHLQQWNLLEQNIGGDIYPRLSSPRELQKLAPSFEGQPYSEAARRVLSTCGSWVSSHLLRTAMICERLLKPITMSDKVKSAACAACVLLAYSFEKKNRVLLRKEYLGRGSLLLRKEIASLLKDSAFQLSASLQLVEEASIVALVGRYIAREEVANDSPTAVAASAVMVAELIDRTCFQSGFWNSRAAYSLLRRIKAGKARDIHPAVLCCAVKLLSESISSQSPAHLVHKSIRDNPELREFAQKIRDQEIDADESKVALSDLAPGMRLTRPLYTFDGTKILSEDLLLDQDLIWRIWQLSALRPLNAPVVVVRSKKSKKRRGMSAEEGHPATSD